MRKGYNDTTFKSIFLVGVESQLSSTAKYLGIIFDRKVIRHIFLYGVIVWDILRRVLRMASVGITGELRTTTSDAANFILSS